jgi:hypothetical protein
VSHIQPPDRPLIDAEADRLLAETRRQLAYLLRPLTRQEVELVQWLGQTLDLQRLLVLVELVEYRHSR